MSILIKDMEMPAERGSFNLTIKYNGTVLDTETGMQVAEVYELPPHGDLIDRDPFIEFIKTHWDSSDQWFAEQLEARPTIISAEADDERREYEAQAEAAQYCEMYEPTYDPETGAM